MNRKKLAAADTSLELAAVAVARKVSTVETSAWVANLQNCVLSDRDSVCYTTCFIS
jgi:hypothetical protein